MRKKLVIGFVFAACTALAQNQPHSPVPVPPFPSNLLPGKTAPGVTDIWVVFKTHCDLGYTLSADAVNEKYRVQMMDNAIRMIEADRAKPAAERFKWTIAGWPMARNILGPKQDPVRKAKIEQALREGTIVVHALPATMESDVMDMEDYVRSLGFSSSIARTYGQPLSISCKMTDVPAHSWFLPTLLTHAGVKFFQLGYNYSCRGPMTPQLFWWEAPDGSRLLTFCANQYGSSLTPPKDWPAKNYLAVVMTHDNEGPPSPGEVAHVRDVISKMPGVTLHFSSMDDFAKALLAEKPELPVIRGDMVDPWIHGVAAMPVESETARRVRPLLPALDLMDTELRVWGLTPAPLAGPLAEAYENSMLYGEHTWGAMCPWYGFWAMPGLPGRFLYGDAFRDARAKGFYKKFESSFDDHRAFIRKTEAIANAGLTERLQMLAKAVKQNGERVVVFNPLPWERSGIVEINGKRLFADAVPANGYKTLSDTSDLSDTSALSDKAILKTAHFTAAVDLKRGGISSLVEKATGRELVDQASPYILGQFLHEKFSQAQTLDYYNRYNTMNNSYNGTVKPDMPADAKYAALTPPSWKATLSRSPLADVLTLTAVDTLGLAKAINITFTFPKEQASVNAAWRIVEKTPDAIPEGGWLCFPFAVKDARFTVGRLGGPMDLAKDQIAGGNRHLYGVHTGAAVTDIRGAGMALCSPDAPLMSFGEPGLWKYTFDYLPKNGTIFVHLYNNMWNTNFPYWIDGSWSASVCVWPVAPGTTIAETLAVKSWETRLPLLAASASGPGGQLPKQQAGLTLSRKGVLVTAFGADPDGSAGTLLRLWEQAGNSGPITVTLPSGATFKTATPVNLRGEKAGESIVLTNNKLNLTLRAYAPASIILK